MAASQLLQLRTHTSITYYRNQKKIHLQYNDMADSIISTLHYAVQNQFYNR